MQGPAIIELLVVLARIVDRLLNLAIERQKAGNLEALRLATQLAKEAKTEDEKRRAALEIRRSFQQR